LGSEYYYTCHLCKATYCYIHAPKHARAHGTRKEKNIESAGTILVAVSELKSLDEAFGVDGSAAIEVAKMIGAHRREEIGHR
jgi:hypothetical protein